MLVIFRLSAPVNDFAEGKLAFVYVLRWAGFTGDRTIVTGVLGERASPGRG
jgi:hypothetical protein